MLEATRLLTLDEYIERYAREGAFEVYDGEIIPLMPNVTIHGWIIRTLFLALYGFCRAHGLGEVFTELPFVLTESTEWVKGSRVPDVLFFASERWKHYIETTDDWQHKPFILVPDLAVEVVSEHDRYTELQKKIAHYRAVGVRLVWIVEHETRTITVYTGERALVLQGNDALDGGDILPGFSLSLTDIFEIA